jgi:HK97 family phage major capsid protein
VTTAITQDRFLVGDFRTGAAFYLRMEAIIEAGTINEYFIQNKIALRCEERGALAVYKPAAFCTGTFSQSPL